LVVFVGLIMSGCTMFAVYDPLEGVSDTEKRIWAYAGRDVLIEKPGGGYSKLYYRVDRNNYQLYFLSEKPAVVSTRHPMGEVTDHIGRKWQNAVCQRAFQTGLLRGPRVTTVSGAMNTSTVTEKNIFTVSCVNPQRQRVVRAQRKAETDARILQERKSKCKSYGFKEESEGMGLCLIELEKLDVLSRQAAEVQRNNQAQRAEQQRQREAQALMNLGKLLQDTLDPPVREPLRNNSTILRIPSAQECPQEIANAFYTRQEREGFEKICYYR